MRNCGLTFVVIPDGIISESFEGKAVKELILVYEGEDVIRKGQVVVPLTKTAVAKYHSRRSYLAKILIVRH